MFTTVTSRSGGLTPVSTLTNKNTYRDRRNREVTVEQSSTMEEAYLFFSAHALSELISSCDSWFLR
jgi:hypothetical protein